MALKPCRECGQQVSTEAEVCPHCGVRSPTATDPIAALRPSDATKRGRGPFNAIIVLVVLIVLAVLYAKNQTQTTAVPPNVRTAVPSNVQDAAPTEVVQVTAESLLNAYDNNEVATDISLKGKIVEVTGRVQSINKDFWDKMYVSLETRNQFMSANMHVISSQKAEIAALRKGQVVVFRCKQMTRMVGSPWGSDCNLISAR